MDKTVEQLEKSIREMSFAYYEGNPIVSDYIFDQTLRELKDKDPDNIILDMVGLGYKVIGDKRLHGICLLYTSPSPRDRTRSRMPSSA